MTSCLYCGGSEKLGTEHLVPKSRGGSNIPENLFTACRRCNASKGNRLPSEWREDLPADIYALERKALTLHPPLKPPNKKALKTETISIKCTEQQKAALDVIAASEGLGVSTWLLCIGLSTLHERQRKSAQR